MKFLNDGVERVVVDFQVDMEEKERDILFEYSRKTMTEEEYENIMINWAMVDILQKQIDNTLTEGNQ